MHVQTKLLHGPCAAFTVPSCLAGSLQSLQAQAVVDAAGALRGAHSVAAAVAPPMAAPASVAPARLANMVSVKEAITGMFSRGCDVAEVTEFWLPHQYLLMRTSLHQHSDVNKYPPELKPKRLRKDVQVQPRLWPGVHSPNMAAPPQATATQPQSPCAHGW